MCSVCHQTWFKQSVVPASRIAHNTDLANQCLTGYKSVDNREWLCRTCLNSISRGNTPTLSVANNMAFPNKPPELYLHKLEERLIALRIPFMQIRSLPRGNQQLLAGNVVNVPCDINPTIKALPRLLDDSATIAVKFKKKLSYSKCDYTENVRPNKVLQALHWLLNNSQLYKNAGISIDNTWIERIRNPDNEDMLHFVNRNQPSPEKQNEQSNMSDSDTDSDNFSEIDDKDVPQCNMDTLLEESQIHNNFLTFAPGEGQKPVSIFQDTDAEYLAFPTIFCGQQRASENDENSPYYSDICKWELRRVAESIPNIFFKLKKIQIKHITDKVHFALRRCKPHTDKITVGDLLNPDKVNNLINLDEGFYIFRGLRSSPPYLEKRKKDVFAMIRQLGLPTWFISLSAGDTKWKDLHKILGKLVDNKDYTDDELHSMDWKTTTRLLQSDPVTCARFFDHRVQQFINNVLKSNLHPIGHVKDYFYRVEFQQRGSPHIHMVVWIENAPKHNEQSNEQITEFID